MSVVSMIVGAVEPDGATFVCHVNGGGPVRVAVSSNPGMVSPTFTSSQAVDAQGVAKVSITGLSASTRYYWRTEDNSAIDATQTGQFVTRPPVSVSASFVYGMSGDAGLAPNYPGIAGSELDASRVSNHPIFDTIRTRALSENWQGFHHLGDRHYYNLGVDFTGSLANYRQAFSDILAQPLQHALYNSVCLTACWDDHDFDGNDSDGTYASKANAATVERERMAHYAFPDSGAIYNSWPVGRVLFVNTDLRYYRSPNSDPDNSSKTMLGPDQKLWFKDLIAGTDAELVIWLNTCQWIGTSSDSWGNFSTEREELIDHFNSVNMISRLRIVGADAHLIGIDDGSNPNGGGIPVLQAASLDATPTGDMTPYSLGAQQGRGQYGTVQVIDVGHAIAVRLSAWEGTTEVFSFQSGFSVATAASVASGALLRTLPGTHRVLIDARLVPGRPTGPDPSGEDLEVIDGEITYDSTAEVFATGSVEVKGINEDNYTSAFPRMVGDPLAPYGQNEIFLRYGVDLGGGGVLWTPLGYFRIEEPDQDDAPYGNQNIECSDRMVGIVEAGLLIPKSYAPTITIGFIVGDLVTEIYPDAVIAWDDDTQLEQIGRTLVVEDSRYDALQDIMNSFGKIMYFDGEGVLQIKTAPSETTPVWEVAYGHDGVLAKPSRVVTRRGINNAVIVTGDAGDDIASVRAIAIDDNPNSPTYFFGPFGQVPHRFESTLITNQDQANESALAILKQRLGANYQARFTAIPNPTLRPWQAVRIVYRDGNREIHVMQSVTIPLKPGETMSGSSRAHIVPIVTTGGLLQ